jgi:transcriptional regulator with XRE-family HTH domain
MSTIKRLTGLTQDDVAALLGVSRSSIVAAEGGRKGPVSGAIQYFLATWPELPPGARERVRARLAELRGGEHAE